MGSPFTKIFNALTPPKSRGPDPSSEAQATPDIVPGLTYVVGDIHGQLDLLQKMDKAIAQDAQGIQSETPTIAYVGDYIDRGPESAHCLNHLCAQAHAPNSRIIHLMGNHEELFLGFIDGDMPMARKWLVNGGRETLLSFGITPALRLKTDDDLESLREKARDVIPDAIVSWVRALPRFHQIGNLVVTHAALDPALSLEDQDPKVLTWGHPRFLTTPRSDDLWVVHGHTITRPASVIGRRVAVDTGAYRNRELTAAVFAPDHPIRFLSVTPDDSGALFTA